MFGETLLESSPRARKGKRWPMATAFTVETLLAAVVVIVPLLSTGVIPLSARMQPPVQLQPIRVEPAKPIPDTRPPKPGATTAAPRQMEVVLISNNRDRLSYGPSKNVTTEMNEAKPGNPDIGSSNSLPELGGNTSGSNVKPQPRRIPISEMSPAQLINRVEPVYPRIAVISGVQGEVKLHAIIARDGRIISLNVISGHPLLAHAAEDAVSQWRYRPYFLNGQPVEVETFITVHFTRDRQ